MTESNEMSEPNEDVAACDAKLGKAPPMPDEKNVIVISENIADRLQDGNDNRVENYEKYWIDKLACIDESHTVRNNIDIVEAEDTLRRLTEYVHSEKPKFISEETNKVKDCLARSRGETLQCSEDVRQFIQQVDRSMYESVRKDNAVPRSDKKVTYAERFKRSYAS